MPDDVRTDRIGASVNASWPDQPVAHAAASVKRWRLGGLDALFAALSLLSTLPLWLVRYPQNADYLNHLARLFVLTAPADDSIHAFYRVNWHLMPNLGIEIIGWPLAQLLPIESVMKIIWAIGVLGTAFSVWFLHRSVVDRTQPTLLLATIALINLPLTAGLFNFTLGLQVAFIAIGLWFRMGEGVTPRSAVMLNLFAAFAMLMHVAAAAALILTIGALHLSRRPVSISAMLSRAAAMAMGFVAPAVLAIAMVLSRSAPPDMETLSNIRYLPLEKLRLSTAPVFTGNYAADLIASLLLWLVLLALPLIGRTKIRAGVGRTLVTWLIVILALPFGIGIAALIDLRLSVAPVMLLVASISFIPKRRITAVVLGGVIVLGAMARLAILVPAWLDHDAHVASFRSITNSVERGAKILVADAPVAETACVGHPIWSGFEEHIPTLLVIDRADFVSTVFDAPDVQPIEPMPAMHGLAMPDIGIIPFAVLVAAETDEGRRRIAKAPAGDLLRSIPVNWRRDYDYVALRRLNCAAEIAPQPDFVPVAESLSYRIYRINHASASR